MKETEVEPVLAAFLKLSVEQQAEFEAEFQDVNALAGEGGVAALLDEADFHGDDTFVDDLAKIAGFHAKVMWAFLEKPIFWRGATMFLHADNVSVFYWKKRNDLPKLPPHVGDADTEALWLRPSVSCSFERGGARTAR